MNYSLLRFVSSFTLDDLKRNFTFLLFDMSASAALKGYRTQFLYSLSKILSTLEGNYIYKPEGFEDFDIYDKDENLQELIQVKNIKAGVRLSDIVSSQKTSFIGRALELNEKVKDVKFTLVSFTSFSNELELLIQNDWTSQDQKLVKDYKLDAGRWRQSKPNIQLIIVNESDLIQKCLQQLKGIFTCFEPKVTMEVLLYWMALLAEKGGYITKKTFFQKIEEVELYVGSRTSLLSTYGTYLKSLWHASSKTANAEILKNEYYSGINARIEHIELNLDVVRDKPLHQIYKGFTSCNNVIVHGSSGQGKSTVAYRYIYDFRSSHLVQCFSRPLSRRTLSVSIPVCLP